MRNIYLHVKVGRYVLYIYLIKNGNKIDQLLMFF